MSIDADLPKLYRQPINVWVEDSLTSEYLNEVWREPRVSFLIAGGSDSIKPVVVHAARIGATNVFGVVDRDFENTNRDRWANDPVRHFVLPVHEMENYLLDEKALAGCELNNQAKLPSEITSRMRDRAEQLHSWMAICHTLKQIRRHCLDDFIQRPSTASMTTLEDAWQHIEQSAWYRSFRTRAADMGASATVRRWLEEAYDRLGEDLRSDAWKRSFSGKEILRDVRGFVYQPPKTAPPPVHDVDLAQSVARWQADNGHVPKELTELLDLLRRKAGVV